MVEGTSDGRRFLRAFRCLRHTDHPTRMPFTARDDPELSPDAIRAARTRVHPAFVDSPQFVHDGLSARVGRPIIVKVETVNPIGAFKGRGTWLAVEALAGEGRARPGRPIVAASTGNFGVGLAFAARAFGVPAVVFADEHANRIKLDRIRALGAEVRQEGTDFDEARAAAEAHAAMVGGHLLVDGADPWVATGAATIALEVSEAVARGALPTPAAAFVPVGNGALIVGIGAWLRHAAPDCLVIGAQAAAAPSMTRSWESGAAVETPSARTFAEGIATRVPVPEALDMMVGRVDAMRLFTEADLRDAQRELGAALGISVEGGAAASWAAARADGGSAGPALVIVTGANAEAQA